MGERRGESADDSSINTIFKPPEHIIEKQTFFLLNGFWRFGRYRHLQLLKSATRAASLIQGLVVCLDILLPFYNRLDLPATAITESQHEQWLSTAVTSVC
jgi:hypothetical protein